MEWLYILGIGLNGWGFQIFMRPGMDAREIPPALNILSAVSAIGGIVLLVAGFFVFVWWVPIVGLLFGPLVANLFLASSSWILVRQASMAGCLVLTLIAVLGAS